MAVAAALATSSEDMSNRRIAANVIASLVRGAKNRVPIAFSVSSDRDLPRLTAHGAVLDILLTRSATLIDVELDLLTAIGTTRLDLYHVVRNVVARPGAEGYLAVPFFGFFVSFLRLLLPLAMIPSSTRVRSLTNGTVGWRGRASLRSWREGPGQAGHVVGGLESAREP